MFSLLLLSLLLPQTTGADLEAPAPRWSRLDGAWTPDGGPTWSPALDRTTPGPDQFVEARINVAQTGTSAGEPWEDKPGPFGIVSRGDGLGISRDYHATLGQDRSGENDLTGDAALYLRHNADENSPAYYRVQILARGADCGQVLIYSPSGGIVAVKPFPFQTGTAYLVRAAVQGNTVTVSVDGAVVLVWTDGHAARPTAGRAGIGTLRAKVSFTDVRTGTLPPGTITPPAAVRRFKLRPWNAAYPHLWLFDGEEPVFQLYESGGGAELRSVKLRPSHRPALETLPLQVTQWVNDTVSLSAFQGLSEDLSGPAWKGTFRVQGRAGDARATITLGVAFDAVRNAYVYDYAASVSCPSAWPVHTDIEWLDLFPAAIMSARGSRTPSPRQNPWDWFAWEQPGGRTPRKQNMSHHWRTLGVPEGGTSPLFTAHAQNQDVAPKGLAAWGTAGDLNISVRVMEDVGRPNFVELCEWALDVHWRLRTPEWRKGGVPAGTTFSLRAQITSAPPKEVGDLIGRAVHLLDGVVPDVRRPELSWPDTTFDAAKPGFEPAPNAAFFTGGVYDAVGGIGGSGAMRLDASHRTLSIEDLGRAAHFPEAFWRFGRRSLRFKARTQAGTATLSLKLAQRTFRTEQQEQTFSIGPAWTDCTLPAGALNAMHEGSIRFRHEGGAPLWIDDLVFSEVPSDPAYDAVWEPEAYVGDRQAAYLVEDAAAGNGYAVAFKPGNDKGGLYLNSYDTALPAGEYEILVRCKVSRTTIQEPLAELWFSQRNSRGVGAAQPLPGAKGRICGTSLSAADRYQDVRFTLIRDAAGALEPHLEYGPGARQGSLSIDRIAVRRLKDAWGRTPK